MTSEEAMDNIDRGIEQASRITMEQALEESIARGDIDIREAELILEAFRRPKE